MLLLLQLISFSSVAFGQFFRGGHPLTAGHSGLSLSPYGGGESEALPISQEELAQLMAQSLASSSGKNYGPPPFEHKQNEQSDHEDFGSNFEGGEEGAAETPQQPDEESNNESGYEQQERGEGSPYQEQQQGHSEEEQGGSDEPKENNDGYENSAPNYQQEGEQYQSGQYPDSQSYGSHSSEEQQREPQSGVYDKQSSQYEDSSQGHPYEPQGGSNGYQGGSAYKEYENAVNARGPQYPNDYSYTGPGSGYSGPGSESFLTYDIRNSPNRYRS